MSRIEICLRLATFTLDVHLAFGVETVVLFGPSGAGKSLTLQAIAGLVRPERGRIQIDDALLFDHARGIDLPPQARRIGYLMQDYALFPHLTVEENIAFGLFDLRPGEREERVAEMLALLRLESLRDRRPRSLSGGQQQRTALARALAIRPRLLLLDEPFAALDAPLRARLRRELRQLQPRLEIPMLLVTHDLPEAHMLADRMAVLDDGRLVQIGSPQDLLNRPATVNVARFTGARNILAGRLERSGAGWSARTSRGRLLLPERLPAACREGEWVQFSIRPDSITLHPPGEPAPPDALEVRLPGRIVGELDHGLYHTLFVHLDGSGTEAAHVDLEVELSRRLYRELGVGARKHWGFRLPAEDIHVIGVAVPPYFEGPAPQPMTAGALEQD